MTDIAPNYLSFDDPLRMAGTVSVGIMAGHRVLELGDDLFRLGYKIPKTQSYFIKALPTPVKLLLMAGVLPTLFVDSVDAADRLFHQDNSNKINDALILAGGCVTAASLLAGAAVSFGVASPALRAGLALSSFAGLAIDFGGFAYGALATNATWQQNLFQLAALLVFNGGREERAVIKSFFVAKPLVAKPLVAKPLVAKPLVADDLPEGYALIPEGKFLDGPLKGQTMPAFGMKRTPVTNAEWREAAQSLGKKRLVVLEHNDKTGETEFVRSGETIEQVMEGEGSYNLANLNFDLGDIMELGALRVLKMMDAPSAQYDKGEIVFSGETQPVVGVSYFHGEAWCLIQTSRSNGRLRYDLPTDDQYYYVAGDRGTKDMGTETGSLYGTDGRKLAHIDEYNDGKGTTAAVDDPRYVQKLPFGVQTTGNVWRWIKFNLQEIYHYGLRGGSWGLSPVFGRASVRNFSHPGFHYDFVGFSPVVVRQDS